MNRMKMTALAVALALAGLCATWAHAVVVAYTPTAVLNIDVTISAAVSVQVDGAGSSSYTAVGWSPTNRVLVSPSTATVTNVSGGLNEQWWLSTRANSINITGNAKTWSLAASTITTAVGADSFAVQAVFVSSVAVQCPAYNDWRWATASATPLTTVPAQYTGIQNQFWFNEYDTVDHQSWPDNLANNTMSAYIAATGAGQRALCWRVVGPSTTSTPEMQNIQIIVTAVQGT